MMLRALETLQRQNDTRRLRLVSMNREGACRDFMLVRGRFGGLRGESRGRILQRCGTFHKGASACDRQFVPRAYPCELSWFPMMKLPFLHQENSRSEEHTSQLQSRQYLVCRL